MPTENIAPTPKVFISYSWAAQEWAVKLAERLMGDGIDVVIDVWYLKEGQDKYVFMERMVQDDSIKNVLMICDKTYTEKANARTGGVGDEAQIISKKIYGSVNQAKFIPIIREWDKDGKEYTPHYLGSRIYIDLSDPLEFEEGYERLVRTIFDKPSYQKPQIGRPPSYILDEGKAQLSTTNKLNAFRNAIASSKPSAPGFATDYLDALDDIFVSLEVGIPAGQQYTQVDISKQVLESIEKFLPYRDEFIGFVILICKYGGRDQRLFEAIRDFFAKIARYLSREYHPTNGSQLFSDNYHFVIGELFLYTITVLVKYSQFEETNIFLSASYQDHRDLSNNRVSSYPVFLLYMKHLDVWHRQNFSDGGNYLTFKILKERASYKAVSFLDIVGVDYALSVRHFLHPSTSRLSDWVPITVNNDPYSDIHFAGIPLFVRASSHSDFKNLCHLLDISDKQELLTRFKSACEKIEEQAYQYQGKPCEKHKKLMSLDTLDTM